MAKFPGATAQDCGTWLLHDLPMARYEAQKYLTETLNCATEENLGVSRIVVSKFLLYFFLTNNEAISLNCYKQ